MDKSATTERRNLFVRLDDDTYRQLQKRADDQDRSLSSYVRRAIQEHLKEQA